MDMINNDLNILTIQNVDFSIMDDDTKNKFEQAIKDLQDESTKDKSEDDKEVRLNVGSETYKRIQNKWNHLDKVIAENKFNLPLFDDEVKYLKELLFDRRKKYNIYEILIIDDIINKFNTTKMVRNEELDWNVYVFEFDIAKITYLFHILKETKVYGVNEKLGIYVNIITKIGNVTKLTSEYDKLIQDLISDNTLNVERPMIKPDELENDNEVKELDEISEFIKNNTARGGTEEEKDNLYKQVKERWNEVSNRIFEKTFILNLDAKELSKIITSLNKIEYDMDTAFAVTSVYTDLMQCNSQLNEKAVEIPVNIALISNLLYVLNSFTLDGNSNEKVFHMYTEIINKIQNVNKKFAYIDNYQKKLSADIAEWVALFDENVDSDKVNN